MGWMLWVEVHTNMVEINDDDDDDDSLFLCSTIGLLPVGGLWWNNLL